MQSVLAEFDLDMAPSDTQFENLKNRVRTLETKPATTASRTPTLFIIGTLVLPALAAVLTIFFGVLPHMENYSKLEIEHQVNSSLKEPLQQIQQMGRDIAGIKARLDDWAPFMVPEVFKRSSAMRQNEFDKSLASLRSAMKVATQAHAVIPNDTLQKVAQKLHQTNESSPDYWTTVLQFIQFASASLIAPTDVLPANTKYTTVSNITCAGARNCIVASHCAVILDGGHIPNSIFDHCRIRFTNNPVGLEGTRFIDCIFEIPADVTQPSPYLKNSARTLLASDLRKVTFPG